MSRLGAWGDIAQAGFKIAESGFNAYLAYDKAQREEEALELRREELEAQRAALSAQSQLRAAQLQQAYAQDPQGVQAAITAARQVQEGGSSTVLYILGGLVIGGILYTLAKKKGR